MGFDLANQHYFGLRGMRGECGQVAVSADSETVTVPTGMTRIALGIGIVHNSTFNSCQPAYTTSTIADAGTVTFRRTGCVDMSGTLNYILFGH